METLNAKGGTGSTKIYYSNGDADNNGELDPPPAGTTHPPGFVDLTPTDGKDDHQWTVPKLLRPDGSDADTDPEVHLDFYPSTPADKEKLKRKFWEKWGIEKFNALVYTHDTINGPYLSVHTWNIAPGGMPYPAGPYKIPLTVTASAPGGSDKGEKITSCSTKLEHVTEAPRTHAMREDRFFQKCKIDKNLHPHSYRLAIGGGLIHNNVRMNNPAHVTVGLDAIVCKGNLSPLHRMYLSGKSVWLDGSVLGSLGFISIGGEAEVKVNLMSVTAAGASVAVRGKAVLHANRIVVSSGHLAVDNAKVKLDANNRYSLAGNVKIYDEGTEITGKVAVKSGAKIHGGAKINGTNGPICIKSNARISGVNTRITGTAAATSTLSAHCSSAWPIQIAGGTIISGGEISGKTIITGAAQVSGNPTITGTIGHVLIMGSAQISGNPTIEGKATIAANAQISGNPIITGNNVIHGNAVVEGGDFSGATSALTYHENNIRGWTTIKGGRISYAVINGTGSDSSRLIVEDGAEIRGKPSADGSGKITVTGAGVIDSTARICQDMTVSGTISGEHPADGTCK